MLCNKCQSISFSGLTGNAVVQIPKGRRHNPIGCCQHHSSMNLLQTSAESGCPFCNRLVYAFQDWELTRIRNGPNRQIWITAEHDKSKEESLVLKVYHGKTCANVYLTHPEPVIGYLQPESEMTMNLHTGSESAVRLAARWMSECTSRHDYCQNHTSGNNSSQHPTRLIDVGSSTASPFLHINKGSRVSYVALSHCWGKARIITTTSQNIQEHTKKISMTALSKTFQDAITFTRELGIKYLWIDSLCIIQNSKPDWETEAARMGDYYKNAELTIAASYASDGSVGCFQPRNPLVTSPLLMTFSFSPPSLGPVIGKKEYKYVVHQFSPDHLAFHKSEWETSALDKRGWCMQEAVLSARLLKFDKATIRWICGERVASESLPWGSQRISDIDDDEGLEPLQPTSQLLLYDFHHYSSRALYNIWLARVVVPYTQRRLTQSSDLLPALAGLAGEIRRLLRSDTYLAGLWRGDLLRGLMWEPSDAAEEMPGKSQPVNRAFTYRSPTWSWASVDACSIYYRSEVLMDAVPFLPLRIISA